MYIDYKNNQCKKHLQLLDFDSYKFYSLYKHIDICRYVNKGEEKEDEKTSSID